MDGFSSLLRKEFGRSNDACVAIFCLQMWSKEDQRVCDEQTTGVEIKRVPQMRRVFENMIFLDLVQ